MKRYYILTMALLLAAVTQAQDASADSISIKELSRALEGRVCDPVYFVPTRYEFTNLSMGAVPLLVTGIVAKSATSDMRTVATGVEPTSHQLADNALRFAPLVATWGLKACGVEGRSNWAQLAVSNAVTYAVVLGAVEALKHTVNEVRPDASDSNSFPSGHVATAFAAATILHKEYGLTRSPWYSIAGYTTATATSLLRSLHNRHWASDLMTGAGIGIVSTNLGYLVADLIFKTTCNGIPYFDTKDGSQMLNPSFFSGSMAATKTFGSLEAGEDIALEAGIDPQLELGLATSAGIEGAWFLNRYVGLGGRLDVTSMPVSTGKAQSVDHLPMYTLQAGAYGSLPLSHRTALGAKVVAGMRSGGTAVLHPRSDNETLTLKTKGALAVTAGLNVDYLLKKHMSVTVFADYTSGRMNYSLDYQRPTTSGIDGIRPGSSATSTGKHTLGTLSTGAALRVHF